MKNYRKLYKEYYGINFDNNFEVHHIDFNHNNNEISNLVLLPKNLHRKYHFYLNAINCCEDKNIIKVNCKIQGNVANMDNYMIHMFQEFIPILYECNKWYDKKCCLDLKKKLKESVCEEK